MPVYREHFQQMHLFAMDELLQKKPDLVFWITVSMYPGQYYLQEEFEGLVHHFWKTERMSVSFCFVIKMGTALEGR